MTQPVDSNEPKTSTTQDAARIALGLMLVTAGTSHLTFAREPFKAQVPPWLPLDPDTVVLQSGIVEISLGAALVCLPQHKSVIGSIAGAFFTAIFPGNIAQYQHRRNAFGLDTGKKRFARLFFQPLLIAWALWSTGAIRRMQEKRQQSRANKRLLKVIAFDAGKTAPATIEGHNPKLMEADAFSNR
jgi:uncharacterized membrane protein